jgi:arsenate reductase
MGEGLLKHICQGKYDIYSAGIKPSIVRPEAIKALKELNIDISDNRSKSIDEFEHKKIDFILTVCDNAKENCPYFPAQTKIIHHSFEDPADTVGDEETRVEAFRKIRDEIQSYLPEFIRKIQIK